VNWPHTQCIESSRSLVRFPDLDGELESRYRNADSWTVCPNLTGIHILQLVLHNVGMKTVYPILTGIHLFLLVSRVIYIYIYIYYRTLFHHMIDNVYRFSHVGHNITSSLLDGDDIFQRRNTFVGQTNNVLWF